MTQGNRDSASLVDAASGAIFILNHQLNPLDPTIESRQSESQASLRQATEIIGQQIASVSDGKRHGAASLDSRKN